jgi:hypothetical protein
VVYAAVITAAIFNVGLAALKIDVSGFLFGSGPESIHGGQLLMAAYTADEIACRAATIA